MPYAVLFYDKEAWHRVGGRWGLTRTEALAVMSDERNAKYKMYLHHEHLELAPPQTSQKQIAKNKSTVTPGPNEPLFLL